MPQENPRKGVATMATFQRNFGAAEDSHKGCDSRTWSGSCKHAEDKVGEDLYLCDVCGVIEGLDHEVCHEGFPHVCGDYTTLC
jgi:hypothetical protein